MGKYLDLLKGMDGGGGPPAPASAPPRPARVPGPTDDAPAAWRAWYATTVEYQVRMARVAGRPRTSALRLAYGCAQDTWHRRLGERPTPDHCAGCGELLDDLAPVEVLADRARVHPSNECWIAYGERWRGATAEGLRGIGIEAPEGWEA